MARDWRHAEAESAKGGWLATACEGRILDPSFHFDAVMVRRNFMCRVFAWEMGVYCGIVELWKHPMRNYSLLP